MTETIWPGKSKIFIFWPFIGKACWPLIYNMQELLGEKKIEKGMRLVSKGWEARKTTNISVDIQGVLNLMMEGQDYSLIPLCSQSQGGDLI
jgi:hypothetical protein